MSDEPYAFGPTADQPQAALPPAGVPYDGATAEGAPGPAAADNAVPEPVVAAPWGGRPPARGRKRRSTLMKSLSAVGVAAVIAVGGTVAITSANADNTGAAPTAMQPMGGYGPGVANGTGSVTGSVRQGGSGAGMASRSLVAGALHGEFVVADGTGTVTERLQTGSISSVGAASMTVLSTDQFTATYAVPSGVDVSALATGTTVTVVATVDGNVATVASISVAGGAGGSGTGGFTRPDGAAPGAGAGSSDSTAPAGTGTAPDGSGAGTTGQDTGI